MDFAYYIKTYYNTFRIGMKESRIFQTFWRSDDITLFARKYCFQNQCEFAKHIIFVQTHKGFLV